MSVTVREYKNGGWMVDVRTRLADGHWYRERRRLTITSKSAAHRWGQDRERHLLQHGPPQKKKEVPTLEEFAPKFLEGYARADRHKPSGVASKESILRIHLIPALGSHKLDAITNAQVQQLKLHLTAKAAKTVNNVLTVLNVVLKAAVDLGVIDRLPCSIRLVPVEHRDAAFHDFDAYERLLDAADAIDWRTYLIVLLGGEGGLRVGEIVALKWADIDLERRQISVRHSDWQGQLTTPKNGRGRFVAMTERVAVALRKHRHLRSSRVLYKDDGGPITRQGAWSRVRYAAHRANVPTGVHILRHSFCSHLVMRGAAMRSVQELVGHQSLAMTQRYSHLSPAALIDTIRLLDARPVESDRGNMVATGESGDRKLNS
jgi:integrase